MFTFNPDNEYDAYWLGFIVADGCLCSRDTNRFRFHIKYGDIEHLELFNTYLESKAHKPGSILPRLNTKHPSVEFNVYSKPLKVALNQWGIYPRKTYSYQLDERLVYIAPFWRGLFDGDGSWQYNTSNKAVKASLAAINLSIIEGFTRFTGYYDIELATHWTKNNICVRYVRDIRRLAKILYPSNETYSLARKRDLALSL